MKLRIEEGDLFAVSDEYAIAHCMSADLAVNMGIAKKINKKYGLAAMLREAAPVRPVPYPGCIFMPRVFNLITQKKKKKKTGAAASPRSIR